MSEPVPASPQAEQTFFNDPALDRTMGVVMALAAEVWVLKDRVHALENKLIERGHLDHNDIDNYQPTETQRAAHQTEREAFVNALMSNLLGEQQSRGIHQ